jgi:hypothetical protein
LLALADVGEAVKVKYGGMRAPKLAMSKVYRGHV